MKYYTYKLTFKFDSRYYYYGVHRTQGIPATDGYFGSGNAIKEYKILYGQDCFQKDVLHVFDTRSESLQEEEKLVGDSWKTDPFCLNRMPGGAFKEQFDVTGLVTVSRNGRIKHIAASVWPTFEQQGWKKGLPDKRVEELHNYVAVNKGNEEKRVPRETVQSWLDSGWKRGRKLDTVLGLKNTVIIHREDQERRVAACDLGQYLEEGWECGKTRQHTEKAADWHRGTRVMNNGTESVAVRPEEIQSYLDRGYVPGLIRKCKATDIFRAGISQEQKGRVWINNGTSCKHIHPEDLESYLTTGWKKGRLAGQIPNTQGMVRLNKEGKRIQVRVCDLEKFEQEGWKRGRGW